MHGNARMTLLDELSGPYRCSAWERGPLQTKQVPAGRFLTGYPAARRVASHCNNSTRQRGGAAQHAHRHTDAPRPTRELELLPRPATKALSHPTHHAPPLTLTKRRPGVISGVCTEPLELRRHAPTRVHGRLGTLRRYGERAAATPNHLPLGTTDRVSRETFAARPAHRMDDGCLEAWRG